MTLTHIFNIDKEIELIREERNRAMIQYQNCTNCLVELQKLKDNESHTNQHKGEESVTQSHGQ